MASPIKTNGYHEYFLWDNETDDVLGTVWAYNKEEAYDYFADTYSMENMEVYRDC